MATSEEGQKSDKDVLAKILEKLKVAFLNFEYLVNSEVPFLYSTSLCYFSSQTSKVEETFQTELSSPPARPVHLSPLRVELSEVTFFFSKLVNLIFLSL